MKTNFSLLLFFLLLLSGCPSPPESSIKTFDPRLPGGSDNQTSTQSVINVSFNTTVSGQITIYWQNPAIYLFTNFTVHVYKRACYQASDSCTITAPVTGSVSIFEIYSGQGSSFTDSNNIFQGQNYTYWIYVEKDSIFDSGVKSGVATQIIETPVTLVDVNNFWQTNSFGIGFLVNVLTPFSAWTPQFGSVNPVVPTVIPGRVAFAKRGTVAYIADTINNRVLIYAKQGALSCDIIDDKNSDEYLACMYSASNEPFVPVNVLGQPNQASNKSCQDHFSDGTIHYSSTVFVPNSGADIYSKCLTSPTGVYVDEANNLIISDTGNNRLVVHKDAPISIACDRNMNVMITTADNCAADFVVGKQSLADLTNYSIATDGESSLNAPTDVVVKDGDLYILDSGNHRVVKAKQFASSSYWVCNIGTWKQPLCSFSAVLGQRGFLESKTFSSELTQLNITITGNVVSDPSFLSKYFESPTSLKITSTGKLLVSSYENFTGTDSVSSRPMEMRSRILVFNVSILDGDIPSCNLASFSSSGCSAIKIIGQREVDEIPVWASNSGDFESQVSYGLDYISSITIAESDLISVQPITNKVKIWSNWESITTAGIPYTYNILDPSGAPNPSNPLTSLPDLQSIGSLNYDSLTKKLLITDINQKVIYELSPYQ